MQIPVRSTCSLEGCPAIQLSMSPTQKAYNIIITCHVKQSIMGEQSADMLREKELTFIWVVVVPTTNKFVACAHRAEGAAVVGQEYGFFGSVHFSLPFSVYGIGAVLTAVTVS